MADGELRPMGPDMPFHGMDPGRTGAGSNLLTTLVGMVTLLVGAIFFIGALVVIAAIFMVVVLVALGVAAIRGVVHALSPHAADRPVEPAQFRPAAVIETTAKVIRSAAPKPRG
jgi:predicted phage tail protein